MDTTNRLTHYRDIIEKILMTYTTIPYAYGHIDIRPSFDRTRDQYLVVNVGWDGERRVHGCLIHVEINNGKVWIERDGTEDGYSQCPGRSRYSQRTYRPRFSSSRNATVY